MTVQIESHRPGLWLATRQLDDFAVRGALIVGSARAVIWDSLAHPSDMGPLHELAAERFFGTVYSHADWDHVWGTAGLPAQGGLVIGHQICRQRFDLDVPATLREKQAASPAQWADVVLIPPTLTFDDELALELGAITLLLAHLPGHTTDCLVGFIPEWGILLAGDTVETPLPVVNSDSPIEAWISGLQRWEHDPRVQTVIPAHGAIGGRELISHNVRYLQQLLAGETWAVEPDWEPFYHQTHAKNQHYAQQSKRTMDL